MDGWLDKGVVPRGGDGLLRPGLCTLGARQGETMGGLPPLGQFQGPVPSWGNSALPTHISSLPLPEGPRVPMTLGS